MSTEFPTEATTLTAVETILRERLPPQWTLVLDRQPATRAGRRPDVVLKLASPDGEQVLFAGEVKRQPTARDLRDALAQLRSFAEEAGTVRPLFIAPWLSPSIRERLSGEAVSFADATGNVRLLAERPGLFLATTGAAKNPWSAGKSLQSLRGKGAMRALRALVDFKPPYGVRELARRTRASAPTLSRVIDLLEREGLVERDVRGLVTDLDWAGAIRRWAKDYDVLRTNEAVTYLQPRGLPALTEALYSTSLRYALTGSLAVREIAPFAPAKLAMAYVVKLREAAEDLDLRPTDAGANVILLEPYDEVVFERTLERNGLRLASPTQLAVDLLTGPGRAPSEGEELLDWMQRNIDAWRA